jgi:hypothetical protein
MLAPKLCKVGSFALSYHHTRHPIDGYAYTHAKKGPPPWVRERRSPCEARVQRARRPANGVRARAARAQFAFTFSI